MLKYICISSSYGEYPHNLIFKNMAVIKCNSKEQLFTPKETTTQVKTPLSLSTHTEGLTSILGEKLYPNIGPSKADEVPPGNWGNRTSWSLIIMITYMKPPSPKELLVKVKIPQPSIQSKGFKRSRTCKYLCKISQLGIINNLKATKPRIFYEMATFWFIAWRAVGL